MVNAKSLATTLCMILYLHLTLSVLSLSQTTNFRSFETESLQTTFSNLIKMAESFPNG